MRIPAGSKLHLNAWAIQYDQNRYEDPERFWPERFADDPTITQQSINLSDVSKRDHFAFGAGRRVCPGIHIAERSLGVALMRILWSCNIVPRVDAKWPLDPKDYREFMPGNPGESLPVNLVIRSEGRRKAIDDFWAKEKRENF